MWGCGWKAELEVAHYATKNSEGQNELWLQQAEGIYIGEMASNLRRRARKPQNYRADGTPLHVLTPGSRMLLNIGTARIVDESQLQTTLRIEVIGFPSD